MEPLLLTCPQHLGHGVHALLHGRGLKHGLLKKLAHGWLQADGFIYLRIRAVDISPYLYQILAFLIARIDCPNRLANSKCSREITLCITREADCSMSIAG